MSYRKGQRVKYRHGRGYTVGKITSVDSSAGKATIKNERTKKEVTRTLAGLLDPAEEDEPAPQRLVAKKQINKGDRVDSSDVAAESIDTAMVVVPLPTLDFQLPPVAVDLREDREEDETAYSDEEE